MKAYGKRVDRNSNFFANKIIFLLALVLIGSLYFTVISWLKPSELQSTSVDNSIQESVSFSYKAKVRSSELFPEGGLIEPSSVIFQRITEELLATINYEIQSDKPITGEGIFQPTLVIEAGEYWKREVPLIDEQAFTIDGTETTIINETYPINLDQMKGLITKIEEEIGLSPNEYLLKVTPNIEGKMYYEGIERPLSSGKELVFEYDNNRIQLMSDTEFNEEAAFESNQMVKSTFSLLSVELPLLLVRILSSILSVSIVLFLIYYYKLRNTKQHDTFTEAEKIDSKYRNRLVSVSGKMDVVNKSFLVLDSFKAIEKVANEKDLPIFRYEETTNEKVVYFIVDVDYMYRYEASNKWKHNDNYQVGSDVSYG